MQNFDVSWLNLKVFALKFFFSLPDDILLCGTDTVCASTHT